MTNKSERKYNILLVYKNDKYVLKRFYYSFTQDLGLVSKENLWTRYSDTLDNIRKFYHLNTVKILDRVSQIDNLKSFRLLIVPSLNSCNVYEHIKLHDRSLIYSPINKVLIDGRGE